MKSVYSNLEYFRLRNKLRMHSSLLMFTSCAKLRIEWTQLVLWLSLKLGLNLDCKLHLGGLVYIRPSLKCINTNQYLIDHSALFQYNIVENLMVRSFYAGVPRLCQGLSTFILLEDIKLKDTMLSTLVWKIYFPISTVWFSSLI